MILNSEQILPYIKDPLGLAKPAQIGIDLTIDTIKSIQTSKQNGIYKDKTEIDLLSTYLKIDLEKDGVKNIWRLKKGIYSITFDQGIELPATLNAKITHRSSLGRLGGLIYSAIYDPGFETQQMGAIMVLNSDLIIEHHARVAQIVFEENYEAQPYNGQYQLTLDIK